jgi:hypothetical protein
MWLVSADVGRDLIASIWGGLYYSNRFWQILIFPLNPLVIHILSELVLIKNGVLETYGSVVYFDVQIQGGFPTNISVVSLVILIAERLALVN